MTLAIAVRKTLRAFTLSVDLEVAPGVTVIVGPSGSGKSTLLRLVAGLVRPDSGTIVLGERILSDERTFVEPYRRNVGMVFQEYALFPHLTASANVAYGLRARRLPAAQRQVAVTQMLRRLEIEDVAGARVGELSGGQRQRVALARALIIEPAALLLDEPLSALDPPTRGRVRGELRSILERVGVPTLLVTHDQADRAAFPERVVRIEQGQLLTVAS
jgi:putative spermidine/putrescine transport system ATP-binding protein